jgi:hypothetical protein
MTNRQSISHTYAEGLSQDELDNQTATYEQDWAHVLVSVGLDRATGWKNYRWTGIPKAAEAHQHTLQRGNHR